MAHTKVTKTHSQNTGNANTFSYSGSFDVFKGTEVIVLLDGTALTFTSSTINESASPREYTVDVSAKTIHIGGADLSSGTITIRPETDMGAPTPRATYTPGASVASEDLNNNQLQLMRKAMEYDEQKMSSTGGTMTGDLIMGQNVNIQFEGSDIDAHQTTLTVANPTSDKTITFPDTTGTVVTTGDTGTVATGMIAADAITNAKIADNALDSEHYTAGSINAAHLASSSVTTIKINSDAVTGAKIADDSIDSEHIVDGSIDTAHIADSQITSAKIADGTIVAGDLASDAVTTVKITDLNVTTAKIAADAITGAKIADDAIDSEHLAADSIDAEHYAAGSVDTTALGADAVTGAKIADDAVDSEHLAADSIDAEHYAAASVDSTALASNAVTTSKITDANVTTDKLAADSVTIAKIGCEQTTISDSDSHIPTSGAVVDYVAAQLAPIGGLEVIADDESFPNTIPAAGVVISISDAAGLQVNSSGVSTNGDALDNSTITINGFPSELRGGVGSNADPYVFGSGAGLMVVSTGSSQTYNYHQAMIRESDFVQLSDDINDFNSRYRVNAGEPGSNNDDGDLCWDTNADKMKVYDGTASAWKEVTSTGDFKYLFLCPAGGSGAPTIDGNIATYDLRESSNSGSAATVTSAAQLIVSVNGVIQKANTGTSAPSEGFALVDANTIIFGANLPSSASVFIVQIGSAVTVPTPGDGTVSAAKIAAGAVETAKIADEAVNEAKLQISNAGTNGQYLSKQSGNTGGLTWATVSNQSLTFPNGQAGILTSTNNEIQINSSSYKVLFDTDNTNTYNISFAGPSSLTKTSTYTLPEDGTNGQYLKTNGSGVLSFGTVDLTALSATNLTSGTIPDARFPATLPAVSGANLTGITTVPTGVIVLWSGTIATIPSGWVLCDGSNSTPDLRDRFVVGAKQDDSSTAKTNVTGSLTQTGGAATDSITVSVSGTTGWASNQSGSGMPYDPNIGEPDHHTHSFSGSGSATVDTLPPYYALAYIMKT